MWKRTLRLKTGKQSMFYLNKENAKETLNLTLKFPSAGWSPSRGKVHCFLDSLLRSSVGRWSVSQATKFSNHCRPLTFQTSWKWKIIHMQVKLKNKNVFIQGSTLDTFLALCCDVIVDSKITSICWRTWDRESVQFHTEVLPLIDMRCPGRNTLPSQHLNFKWV